MLRTVLLIGVFALFTFPVIAQKDSPGERPANRRVRIIKHSNIVIPEEAKLHIRYPFIIKLAITLSEDGTVGEIRCLNEDNEKTRELIKYGVVKAAVDAAKETEFEPEIKDGVAVTVTKTVEYTYSIY